MKAGDGATGDGDKSEWEDFAGENRACSIGEARESGKRERRMNQNNSDGEHERYTQLDEGTQIIPWRQKQPNRKHAREKTVNDGRGGQPNGRPGEPGREHWRFGNDLAAENARDHQNKSHDRAFENFAGPPVSQVDAHEESDRHSGGDSEGTPGTGLERVHHNQSD